MFRMLFDEILAFPLDNEPSLLQRHQKRLIQIQQYRDSRLIRLIRWLILILLVLWFRFLGLFCLTLTHSQRIIWFDGFYLFDVDRTLNIYGTLVILVVLIQIPYTYLVSHPHIMDFCNKCLFPIPGKSDHRHGQSLARTRWVIIVFQLEAIQFATFFFYNIYLIIEQVFIDDQFLPLFATFGSLHWFCALGLLFWMVINCLIQHLPFVCAFYLTKLNISWIVFLTSNLFNLFKSIQSFLTRNPLSGTLLVRFLHHHHGLFVFVMDFNRTYSPLYLSLFLCAVPVTLYVIAFLWVGHQTPISLTTLNSANFLHLLLSSSNFGIVLTMLFLHYILALYTKRLHQSVTPKLFSINARDPAGRYGLRTTLKLTNYLLRFHTTKRYGMTYHKFGLITSSTFAKWLLIYSNILLKVYKLLNNLRNQVNNEPIQI